MLPNKNVTKVKAELSEAEQKIVKMAEVKRKIARKDVETELWISQTLSGRMLKSLLDKEILQRNGNGKNTRYLLKSR